MYYYDNPIKYNNTNVKFNISAATNINHHIDENIVSRRKLDTHANMPVVHRGADVKLARGDDRP